MKITRIRAYDLDPTPQGPAIGVSVYLDEKWKDFKHWMFATTWQEFKNASYIAMHFKDTLPVEAIPDNFQDAIQVAIDAIPDATLPRFSQNP